MKEALEFVKNENKCTAIVLENDLYRHGNKTDIDEFFASCRNIVSIDHTLHRTAQQSSIVFPSGTFAESDGTLINNEGRAQRYFQVYEPADEVRESWRWLIEIAKVTGNKPVSLWNNFDDVVHAISTELSVLKGIIQVTPPSGFRINGQKIPREPHRFSGRTSMLANINVSEPKPPDDSDSALSYTMEGFRGLPPSSMIPFFWSPGWNSVQSTNKYQDEVGGSLKGGDPGVRLVSHNDQKQFEYFKFIREPVERSMRKFEVVPLYFIFGSEELSAKGEAVSKRIPPLHAVLSVKDASRLQIAAGDRISVVLSERQQQLTVRLSATLPDGLIGVPFGLDDLPYFDVPSTTEVLHVHSQQPDIIKS